MHSSSRHLAPVTRAVRNGLLLIALSMAVIATAFAVVPSGSAAGSRAGSVVDVPTAYAAGAAPGATAGDAGAAAGSRRGGRPVAGRRPGLPLHPDRRRGPGRGLRRGGRWCPRGHRAAVGGGARRGFVPRAVRPARRPGDGRIYIGSVAGGYEQALAGTGVPLANHAYAFFTSKVPQAAMITVSAGGTKWRDVAAAAPGSALYGQIVAWAQTIKARGQTVMLAYNHEPEAHDRLTLGGAAEFIAAWRNVRTIFDRQGATNVIWTWQMTAYSFRVDPSSEQHAAKWYPGDAWVDNVGADAYNWIDCGATGTGQYNELQFLGDPVIAFARAHGKKASFPAFASHANADRAQWLANAHRYLVANEDILTAAFYFNHPPTIAANAECRWGLTSAAEYGRLREMAQDTAHFVV
jgi:Glycosyl hydrolase family 26